MKWYLITIAAVTLIYVGCESRPTIEPELSVEELLASFDKAKLRSEQAVRVVVENAANSTHSISYIHLAWSIESELNKRKYAQFALDYHRELPHDAAFLHFIDCTSITNDCSALSDLPGWNKDHHIHGVGELIWMKDGRVIHVEEIGRFSSSQDLVAKTVSLFEDGGYPLRLWLRVLASQSSMPLFKRPQWFGHRTPDSASLDLF